jgi:hypothetical protein
MKTRGFAVILSLICAELLAIGALLPVISIAQDVCTVPSISMMWSYGVDDYYKAAYNSNFLGMVGKSCPPSTEYCSPVYAMDYQLNIDGQFSGTGGHTILSFPVYQMLILPEGEHNALKQRVSSATNSRTG